MHRGYFFQAKQNIGSIDICLIYKKKTDTVKPTKAESQRIRENDHFTEASVLTGTLSIKIVLYSSNRRHEIFRLRHGSVFKLFLLCGLIIITIFFCLLAFFLPMISRSVLNKKNKMFVKSMCRVLFVCSILFYTKYTFKIYFKVLIL